MISLRVTCVGMSLLILGLKLNDAWTSPARSSQLMGLRGVRVDVQRVTETLEKQGFGDPRFLKEIYALVAEPLRECGLVILDEEEWKSTPGKPILYVNAQFGEGGHGRCSIRIEGSLYQEARLTRDPSILVGTESWRNSREYDIAYTQQGIRQSITDFVSLFTYSYSLGNSPGCLPAYTPSQIDSLTRLYATPDSS